MADDVDELMKERGRREPKFEHDCGKCVFIGHIAGRDIYTCPQSGIPTIVARVGDDGPDYTSGDRIRFGIERGNLPSGYWSLRLELVRMER